MCKIIRIVVLLLSDGGYFTFYKQVCAAKTRGCVLLSHPAQNPYHRNLLLHHLSSTLSSPQNCTKSPHNSINHFDNHFDAHPKYPSTDINNKLSDNYKIHPIPQNPTILRPNHTYKPRQLISKIFTNQATFRNNPVPSKCFDLSNSSENHLL